MQSLTYCLLLKDVKFPLMLDVYELCTAEVQEKMLPIRSKFKEMEDKKLEKQQKKVSLIYSSHFYCLAPSHALICSRKTQLITQCHYQFCTVSPNVLFLFLHQVMKKPDAKAKEVKYEPFSFRDGMLGHDTDTFCTIFKGGIRTKILPKTL